MSQSDKRRRILDSAVEVFAKHGFYNSKVSQIAKSAGVADGTIYLYFKSKEDILVQVFLDSMARIIALQEDAIARCEDPRDQLASFIRVHFENVLESPALAEVITVELRQSSKFMHGTDMKPFGHYLGIIARIIRDGQEQGVFSQKVAPRRVARMLFGAIDELALEWAVAGERRPSLDEVIAQTLHIFIGGLLKGHEPKEVMA